MDLFSRFRRDSDVPDATVTLPAVLPKINQRITITRGLHDPVTSRVDDERGEAIVIASPNMPLETGDEVLVTWEEGGAWFRLETTVLHVDEDAMLPSVSIARRGRLVRFDDRRTDLRSDIALPLELRVIMARVMKQGRTLSTRTLELSSKAIRFTTSAPLAPGDVVELRVALPGGEPIGARCKVIRMDSVTGSWRQTCTVVYEEILRSDRARLMAFLEANSTPASAFEPVNEVPHRA